MLDEDIVQFVDIANKMFSSFLCWTHKLRFRENEEKWRAHNQMLPFDMQTTWLNVLGLHSARCSHSGD